MSTRHISIEITEKQYQNARKFLRLHGRPDTHDEVLLLTGQIVREWMNIDVPEPS